MQNPEITVSPADTAVSPMDRCMNPIAIAALNIVSCLAVGLLASTTGLGILGICAVGWIGGSALTLILVGICAMRPRDGVGIVENTAYAAPAAGWGSAKKTSGHFAARERATAS